MSLSLFARKALACWCLAIAVPAVGFGQGIYANNGSQYPIAGTLPGEQVHPQLSLKSSGGFLVWEDNVTDGYGLGVSALQLDNSLSGVFAPFRVNATGTNDQERPAVSVLNGGGAAFVWQGGQLGFQHIYARFLSANNTWVTDDLLVNAAANRGQLNPALATLSNGNVVVVYGSMNQVSSNSLQDVYAQILTPTGQKVGGEFLVNQFTAFNQRSASVAALQDGGFVVVWVSEQERSGSVDVISPDYLYNPTNRASVDIFGRRFAATGTPVGGEFLVNTAYEVCASPSVAAGADGGFVVAWEQKTFAVPVVGSDIVARPYSAAGAPGDVITVNSYLYGDQYDPRISASAGDYFVVWTSLAQDGSREGVFGQFLSNAGARLGSEVQVNTTTVGQQMHPCVAGDGNGRFLTVWTSFVGGVGSFDLFSQRWLNVAHALEAMAAPYVFSPFAVTASVYQPQLLVSWAPMNGVAIDHYEVYVNGSMTSAISLTTNVWLMTTADGLTANSTNSFQVAYVTPDGRRSPLSAATRGSTWNGSRLMIYAGCLPAEWVAQYYGVGTAWPGANTPLVAGGPTLLEVFLSGGNPLDQSTWLRTSISSRPAGKYLTWNPQPGLIYQVQTSADLNSNNWVNVGGPRFANGTSDEIFVGGNNAAYYRVLLLR